MNVHRGFFRLWLLFSVLCVLALSSFFFEGGREFIEAISDAMRELIEDLWPELRPPSP